MGHTTILLAFDIDDTIIDASIQDEIQFMGESKQWRQGIEVLQAECALKDIVLIPVLVTSKVNQEPDSTVDFLLAEMGDLFCCREQSGQPYKSDRPNDQYTAMRHLHEQICHDAYNNADPRFNRVASLDPIALEEDEKNIFPPVHIVGANHKKEPSKAHVLHHIAQFYQVPPENVFLIDDQEANRNNLKERFGDTTVPVYQFIKSGPSRKQEAIIKDFSSAVRLASAIIKEEFSSVQTKINKQIDEFLSLQNKADPSFYGTSSTEITDANHLKTAVHATKNGAELQALLLDFFEHKQGNFVSFIRETVDSLADDAPQPTVSTLK
jgi:hypothetical protein